MSIHDKYHCWAATQYREKVSSLSPHGGLFHFVPRTLTFISAHCGPGGQAMVPVPPSPLPSCVRPGPPKIPSLHPLDLLEGSRVLPLARTLRP